MKPIYLIGGWMRSGTSMMVKVLEAGGIPAAYTFGNPDYELLSKNYQLHNDPAAYEGMVIKTLKMTPGQVRPWAGGYKLLFMERDAREQQQSWFKRSGVMYTLEAIDDEVTRALEVCRNRRDTEVMVVRYADVVDYPISTLLKVIDFFGVSLDDFNMEAAVATVDPTMRHHDFDILDMQEPAELMVR